MSKASIGADFLAEMTDGRGVDAVSKSHPNGPDGEGSPDGLENLRYAYQEFWDETHHASLPPATDVPAREKATVKVEAEGEQPDGPSQSGRAVDGKLKTVRSRSHRTTKSKVRGSDRPPKQRFGLPKAFVPRMQRFGRAVLLELNLYRLPNGEEFIPCVPSGTLGSRHLYALVTNEQYRSGERGSVYVRSDGRIFDYSGPTANALDDMFDTGYTLYDLERTGRYVTTPEEKPVAVPVRKVKRKRKKKAYKTRDRHAAGAR